MSIIKTKYGKSYSHDHHLEDYEDFDCTESRINGGKKLKNIHQYVYDKDNLIKAQYKSQKGKNKRGEVKEFNRSIGENMLNIYDMLSTDSYTPGEYRIKTIYEPKERVIMIAPYYPDRIIHHCVINVLGEFWSKTFIENTYACIKGRGTHKCMKDINNILLRDRKGTQYCLKLDVKKFYDNVDHHVLKKIIRYKISDNNMLSLLDKIIDSNCSDKGLPIGNFTSQYLANLYLSYFDHWVKEDLRVKYYYRYMDDIVILHKDKETLHKYFDLIALYLGAELKLEVKHTWQIFPVDKRGIDYVGFKQNHYGVYLRKGILTRFYKKYNRIKEYYKISNETDFKHFFPSEYGWITRCTEEHSNYIINKCIE